jgi:hypothetical protein
MPTRRFPHTSVSSKSPYTCNRVEQTLSPQLYSAKLTRQEKRKDSKEICKAFWLVGLLHLQKALLEVHPYFHFISSHD